jgi:hypothetical protein
MMKKIAPIRLANQSLRKIKELEIYNTVEGQNSENIIMEEDSS